MIDASKFSLDFLRPTGSASSSAAQPPKGYDTFIQEATEQVVKAAERAVKATQEDPWSKVVAHYAPLIQKTLKKMGGEIHALDILKADEEEIKLDQEQLYNVIYRMIASNQLTVVPESAPEEYNPKVALPQEH